MMSKDDRELIEALRAKRIDGDLRTDGHLGRERVPDPDCILAATRLEALQAQPVGEEGPCPDGEHCCCCGPGDTCCDCGLKLIDLEREVALARWTDFLDMNPDDLTSPEDLPDHALVTFEQFYEMARDVLPRIPAALTASPPVVEREAIDRALILAVEDFINEPPRLYDIEPMEVRDYRHSLYRVWSPLRDAILALTPVEGVGEKCGFTEFAPAFKTINPKPTVGNPAFGTFWFAQGWIDGKCYEFATQDSRKDAEELCVRLNTVATALSTPVAQGDEVRDALDRVLEALTPHGETKAAYMGEFSWTEWLPDENGVEQGHERTVPWTTIKEIMAAIRDRASVEKLDEADALATLTKGARDAG
jgi:hypothetical protein